MISTLWAPYRHQIAQPKSTSTFGVYDSKNAIEMTGDFGAGERARTVGLNLGKDAGTQNAKHLNSQEKLSKSSHLAGLTHLATLVVYSQKLAIPRRFIGTLWAPRRPSINSKQNIKNAAKGARRYA
jgi:hypothetical protein